MDNKIYIQETKENLLKKLAQAPKEKLPVRKIQWNIVDSLTDELNKEVGKLSNELNAAEIEAELDEKEKINVDDIEVEGEDDEVNNFVNEERITAKVNLNYVKEIKDNLLKKMSTFDPSNKTDEMSNERSGPSIERQLSNQVPQKPGTVKPQSAPPQATTTNLSQQTLGPIKEQPLPYTGPNQITKNDDPANPGQDYSLGNPVNQNTLGPDVGETTEKALHDKPQFYKPSVSRKTKREPLKICLTDGKSPTVTRKRKSK